MEDRKPYIEEVIRMTWEDPDTLEEAIKLFTQGYETGKHMKMADGASESEVWESFSKHVLNPMIKSIE